MLAVNLHCTVSCVKRSLPECTETKCLLLLLFSQIDKLIGYVQKIDENLVNLIELQEKNKEVAKTLTHIEDDLRAHHQLTPKIPRSSSSSPSILSAKVVYCSCKCFTKLTHMYFVQNTVRSSSYFLVLLAAIIMRYFNALEFRMQLERRSVQHYGSSGKDFDGP